MVKYSRLERGFDMLKKRLLLTFGISYGVKSFVMALVSLLYFIFQRNSNFLFIGGNGYYFLWHLIDFSFNTGFIFVLVLVVLFWDEIKAKKHLRIVTIITFVSMLFLLVFGIVISINFYQYPLNPFNVFGMGSVDFLSEYLFMLFLLSFIVLATLLSRYHKRIYPSQVQLKVLMIVYVFLTFVKFSALFRGRLGLNIDLYSADVLFRTIMGKLIISPIFVIIIFLIARIAFANKDNEIFVGNSQ